MPDLPADDLRGQIARRIHQTVRIRPGKTALELLNAGHTVGISGTEADAAADAALAVRDDELEQLRAQLITATNIATSEQAERQRAEAELATREAAVTEYQRQIGYLRNDVHQAEAERDKFCDAFTDANRRATEAETAIDDALWRMHQLRSWAYRELADETMHNVLAVITNVWDILDPGRTRGPLNAPSGHDSLATPRTDDHPPTHTNPPTQNDHGAGEPR